MLMNFGHSYILYAGEAVPAAEIERLNALLRGERHEAGENGIPRAQRGRGRGRGGNRRRMPRRHGN
jgi:hypothetical protein